MITVALPPLQVIVVVSANVALSTTGSVIVIATVVVHRFASVTVNVCSPAFSPVCAGVMIYGATPPAGVIVTVPVDPPLQSTGVCVNVALSTTGSVIVIATVVVHRFASVTVNVCSPAFSPVCAGVMIYGATPPAGVIVTVPVDPPLHSTGVCVNVALSTTGSVIVIATVVVHRFASVTVNVCSPAASPVCAGVMIYGATPPAGVIVTVPVDPPLHSTGVCVNVALSTTGSVIVIATVVVHRFASVTVNVCSPAASPVCAGVMIYGATPPAGVIVTVPVDPPLHSTGVCVNVALSTTGSVIVIATVVVHRFASVTVNVCSPAASPVCAGVMIYGATPPAGVIVTVPVDPPLHSTGVCVNVALSTTGSVIVIATVVVHRFASVTVNVCSPAASPVCAGVMIYGATPPAGVIVTVPVDPPLHSTGVCVNVALSTTGSVIVIATVVVHRFASVTVNVCSPAASPVCAGVMIYGATPPAGVIVTVPVDPPLHSTGVCVNVALSTTGSVIVIATVVVHRFASVTVNVCSPAASPVCAGVMIYGATPPAGVIVTVPVDPPLHSTGVCVNVALSTTGSVIVIATVVVHRFASVTVNVCSPAASPVCAGVMIYGATPPAGVIVTVPVDPPLHSTGVCVNVALSTTGSVIVIATVVVHRFASVTVNVCSPAASPVCAGVMIYGATPPAGVIVTVPVDPPLHSTGVCVNVALSTTGSVIVIATVVVHRFASVTVNVCSPAASPVCAGVMIYGATPPAGVIVTVPVDPPLHSTGVCVNVALSTTGSVIVIATVVVHRFASVTVNVCSPAASPVCAGVMIYGATPPAGVIVTVPVDPPLHSTGVCVNVALSTTGSVIVIATVVV